MTDGLTDLVEAEDPGRLDVEPTSRSVRRDLLKRHIGQRERATNTKLAKKVR